MLDWVKNVSLGLTVFKIETEMSTWQEVKIESF